MKRPAVIDLFEEIKASVAIADAMSTYGVTLDKHNKALCPLHNEKTPSMVVYPDSNSYYCFGCGTGGSVIDFVAQLYSLEPLEAARKLDSDFGLNLSGQKLTPEQQQEYAVKAAEREQERKLVSDFEQWKREYFNYLTENLKLLEQLEEVSNPPACNDEFTNDYAYAFNRRQMLDYHWNILFSGELEDKISLYMDVCKAARD